MAISAEMPRLIELFRTDGAYFGDRGDWFVAYAVHRDSDALERSNFRVLKRDLEARDPTGEAVAVERARHWAVGWIDYLLVDPACTPLVEQAAEWRRRLTDYPVADEMDWSELEYEELVEYVSRGAYNYDDARHELVEVRGWAARDADELLTQFWARDEYGEWVRISDREEDDDAE